MSDAFTTSSDRALETQTAAPRVVPPNQSIVGLAMADDDDLVARCQAQQRQLETVLAANRATLDRLRAIADRYPNT